MTARTPVERGAEAVYELRQQSFGRAFDSDYARAALEAALDVEDIERGLVAEWHQDQCMCRDFDGTDIETCVTRQEAGTRFCPPATWTVDAIRAYLLGTDEGGA